MIWGECRRKSRKKFRGPSPGKKNLGGPSPGKNIFTEEVPGEKNSFRKFPPAPLQIINGQPLSTLQGVNDWASLGMHQRSQETLKHEKMFTSNNFCPHKTRKG